MLAAGLFGFPVLPVPRMPPLNVEKPEDSKFDAVPRGCRVRATAATMGTTAAQVREYILIPFSLLHHLLTLFVFVRLHRLLVLGIYSPQGTSRRSPVRYTETSIVLTAQCPDPSWSMWVANDTVNDKPDTGAWCCKPDYKGVYRDNGTANYFCTATSISTLQLSYYWAHILTTTTSCSLTATPAGLSTATSTLLASVTPSATSVGTGTGTASSTGTRSESTGTTSPASEEQTGIPVGVKVGAAVGCVAGAALIVAGILFIRKRKQKTIEGVTLTGETEEGRGKPEAKYFHKGTRRPSELETVERTVELDGARPRYELDATRKEDQLDVVSPMSM
ncbi:uncharacterized protein CCOS01_13452 [Colletotrichum costaricense]|uniref:Uncharacterized protein n=1 Tax=Colletotrichum costaricense TaxID=1209916 RepID=A0AAI9YLR9_9PEZI|nr:uncharacterized protein CCOS01_13452 [Colletotrichum costaricense]KAK1515259.1 hypothetical protein CCOS01_13452 [Colletotrichum costaricense]